MTNPERADFFVRVGQRAALSQRMREIGGVEVQTQTARLCIVNPRFEVLGQNLVAIHGLAVGVNAVEGVNIHAVLAGNQRESLVQILHQFFGRPGSSGVVAGCLNASCQRACVFKAAHIVALPAVHGNPYVSQAPDRRFGVHADCRIAFFCQFVTVHLCILPKIVFRL